MTTISEFSAPRPAQILGGGLASLGTAGSVLPSVGGAASSSLYTCAGSNYVDGGLSRTIGSSLRPQTISSPPPAVRTFGTSTGTAITREATALSSYMGGSYVAQPLVSGSYVPTGAYVASGSYVPTGGRSLGTKSVYSSSAPVATGMLRNSSIGTVTSPVLLGSSTPMAGVVGGSCYTGSQSYETIVHPPVPMPASYQPGNVLSSIGTTPLDSTPYPLYSGLSPSPLSTVVQSIGTSAYSPVAGASYVPISNGLSSGLSSGLATSNGVVSTRPISREELLGTGHLITGEEAARAGPQKRPAASRADGLPPATVVTDARPLSYAAQPRAQLTSTGYAARSTSPLQADYGTQPAYDAYGTQPAYDAYGSQPAYDAYGSQPAYDAYGSQPAYDAYGAQPAYDAYGAQPEVYEAVEYVQPAGGPVVDPAPDVYGNGLGQDPYSAQHMMYEQQEMPAEQYMDGVPVSYAQYDDQPQDYIDDQGEPQGEPYTVLPVPDEYMQLLHNLQEIMDSTGCQIQAAEVPGTNEWEVSLFGSPAARRRAHERIENTIAAELSRAEGGMEYYDGN